MYTCQENEKTQCQSVIKINIFHSKRQYANLTLKRKFASTPCRPRKKGVSSFCSYCVYGMPITKQLMCTFKKLTVFLDVNLSLPENCTFSPHIYKA